MVRLKDINNFSFDGKITNISLIFAHYLLVLTLIPYIQMQHNENKGLVNKLE